MNDDVKQASMDRYALSQAYRWRAERDTARQELERVKSKQLSMIGNKERREVAAKLRKASGLTEFAEVLGFDWTDDSDWVWKDVSNLVADLIEPEPERTCKMVDNGSELCCSACDWRHDYDDEPSYCSGCGAKVVDDD